MRFAACLFILLNCLHLKAQREVNVWQFGYGAGIDFNASPPLVLTNGKLRTVEGCASICDEYGKLLMYTDGDTVYNAKDQIMVNGTGLNGTYSTAQSAMIIKLPKSDSLYLIFNPGEVTGIKKGFYYSIVNVNAKGGKGEVTTKNVKLKDNMHTESVSAVKHANGQDVWVVFKNDNSNEFVSYLVTPLGVSNVMTFSQPGPTIGSGSPAGFTTYSKFSPSGKKYAICIYDVGVCLYDFNNKTGYLSNLKILPIKHAYSLEFSPDETKLYASLNTDFQTYKAGIYQYDISSWNLSTILASEFLLLQEKMVCALQLAPDKKIYFVRFMHTYLGTINAPNNLKSAANVQTDAVFLKGKKSGAGLPPFISTYFSDSLLSRIDYKGKCSGDPYSFECANLKTTDSVQWDFGDTASGNNNFSSILKPSHIFSKGGLFIVDAKVFRKNINNNYVLETTLKSKIMVLDDLGLANEYPLSLRKCIHDSVLLQPASGASNLSKVLWNDISGNKITRYIKNPGTYSAKVYKTGSACFYIDTVKIVNMAYVPKPDLGKDTLYCIPFGQTLKETLGTSLSSLNQYIWNTGETTQTIQITQAGRYMVNAGRNNQCPSADTIDVKVAEMPFYQSLNDTALCNDNQLKKIQLDAKGYDELTWNTGETGLLVTIVNTGTYIYTIKNQCANIKDSFKVVLVDAPIVNLGADMKVCSANGFELKSNVVGSTYLWQPDGEISSSIFSYTSGLISLEVKNAAGCMGRDEIFVSDSCLEACFVPNAFTPNEDGLNEVFKPSNNDIHSKGYVFRIYDRWGGVLYETNHVKEGWNGTVDGKRCPAGVYFYTLEFVTADHKKVQMKGTFNLLY